MNATNYLYKGLLPELALRRSSIMQPKSRSWPKCRTPLRRRQSSLPILFACTIIGTVSSVVKTKCRSWTTLICRYCLNGANITGKFVDEIAAKAPLAFFTAQASATVESAEPTYYHDGVARLLLPMWGDGHVAMLLGIIVPL